MEIRIINTSDISECETLRSNAFSLDYGISKQYELMNQDRSLLIIGAYEKDELIGCAYLTPLFLGRCIVEQLFVRSDYQGTNLHVGTSLLRFIEDNVEDISDYFSYYVSSLIIEYCDNRAKSIYMNQGYQKTNKEGILYKGIR